MNFASNYSGGIERQPNDTGSLQEANSLPLACSKSDQCIVRFASVQHVFRLNALLNAAIVLVKQSKFRTRDATGSHWKLCPISNRQFLPLSRVSGLQVCSKESGLKY